MAVTIRDICALPDLRLELVAGAREESPEVRWVHVSEVEDPTPWLKGGELLLTTGLRVSEPAALGRYVHRLAEAGLAGIGFGVGVDHEDIPAEMIAAADERGIALIRVPVDTPYVAISEAVANMLAADRQNAISRAFDAQQRLTRAALGSGRDLVKELARQLDGWAIQTDASGDLVHAWPPEAAERIPELLPDLVRARQSGRAASAVIARGTSSTIQPLSVDGLPRGYLLAGVEGAIGVYERSVLTAALSLLTLDAERSHAVSLRLHRLRASALVQALRDRQPARDFLRQMSGWGIEAESTRICVFLLPAATAPDLLERVMAVLASADAGGACALVEAGDDAHVVVLLGGDEGVLDGLVAVADAEPSAYLGVGALAPVVQLRRSYRGALHAASIGRADRRGVTRFEELAAMQLLLGLSAPGALYEYVEEVLGPLAADQVAGRNAELKRTLEVFLACNGHWSEAAGRLAVHRHTLRTRIDRIAQLTGRDPESAYGRMELWLAVLIEESFAPHD